MNNTLEYILLTVLAIAVAVYASAQLQSLLLQVVNQVASSITGGF